MDHVLQATTRQETGKVLGKFRRQGKVPANIFMKHAQSTQIWVDGTQLSKLMQTANEGSLLYIELGDKKAKHPSILRHVDYDVRNGRPLHASFQEVSLKEKVTVEMEIEIVGEAPATKAGLVVDTPQTSIEIEALPTELPEKIEVDISKLETSDDRITAGDVTLPKGVTLVTDPETTLIAIVEPAAEEPEEAAPVDEAAAVAAVEATEEKTEEQTNS